MNTRVLMMINRASGIGAGGAKLPQLRRLVSESFGQDAVTETVVDDHPQAAYETESFLRGDDTPAIIIVGGGGGTLRAVIEGACACTDEDGLPGPERLRIVPLRMGSGNVLAKQLGIPRELEAALRAVIPNAKARRHVSCCVGRYDFLRETGGRETRYAATLAGFGQLGRVPGDLERWHRRLGWLRRALGALVDLENLTNVEYGAALLIRSLYCALSPPSVEAMELTSGTENGRYRVLAAAVLSFPMNGLPFDPGTTIGEPKLSLHLIPYRSRWQALALVVAPKHSARRAVVLPILPMLPLKLRIVGRDTVEMFLDEDPTVLYREVTISVAGTLAFIPGTADWAL